MTSTPTPYGIVQTDDKRKGRTFSAFLLCAVYADRAWAQSDAKTKRPVYATFAGSDAEIQAFEANLREGRPCAPIRSLYSSANVWERIEFLRGAGYEWRRQRTPDGMTLTAYLPSVLAHEPGFLQSDAARFVVLPSQAWADAQRDALGEAAIRDALAHLDRTFVIGEITTNEYSDTPAAQQRAAFLAHVRAMAPTAHLFVAALDKRVGLPIVPDLAFALQLFLALHLHQRYEGRPVAGSQLTGMIRATRELRNTGWSEEDTDACGFAPGAWCSVPDRLLRDVLAAETERYFKHRATTAATPSKRAASHASPTAQTARKAQNAA